MLRVCPFGYIPIESDLSTVLNCATLHQVEQSDALRRDVSWNSIAVPEDEIEKQSHHDATQEIISLIFDVIYSIFACTI